MKLDLTCRGRYAILNLIIRNTIYLENIGNVGAFYGQKRDNPQPEQDASSLGTIAEDGDANIFSRA